MKMTKLFLLLAFLFVSCGNPQHQAARSLKRMKAEDYFDSPAQIELARAVEQGDVAAMDLAIARGAKVNTPSRQQMTPLFWAMSKQNKAGFQRLLEKGADPNFVAKGLGTNKEQISVMELAAMAEDPDFLRMALKHGGNPNLIVSEISDETVLFTAIRNHRPQNVVILANSGSDINHQSKGGDTPIMMASSSTQYDIAYQLMKMGADLSIRHHVMGPDMKWRRNTGRTFAEQMVGFGDRSIRVLGKEREQREWYNKVVAELNRRGLL
jgi:ankyrin repeat protein